MKNLKGGYKIVSLQNNDLSSGFTLDGIYEALVSSYGKPILVTDIVISGEKKNDVFTTVTLSGTSFIFEVYGKVITVEEDGDITVSDNDIIGHLDLSDYTATISGASITTDQFKALYNSVKGKKLLCLEPFKVDKNGTPETIYPDPQNVMGYVDDNQIVILCNTMVPKTGYTVRDRYYLRIGSSGPSYTFRYVIVSNDVTITTNSGTLSANDLALVTTADLRKWVPTYIVNTTLHKYYTLSGETQTEIVYSSVIRNASSIEYSTITINKTSGTYTIESKTVND